MEAHRYLWKNVLGWELPKSHAIHHTCRNKFCVNPAHLELLTNSNHAKIHAQQPRQHCQQSHELTPENSYWFMDRGKMRRQCKICCERWRHNKQIRQKIQRWLSALTATTSTE